ncbi:pentatricopeptide repeat-containing protein PNM1, mitochondrial [Iris pallida]|uniref:Pentatricopeptide repeat-containing protein PNM1, mitochondrial n=1 Tax=Iris pallida TaxID=29817 RepID=A0AAX6H2F2_IRIPA|nr:pentatricopeptide repeat-containing protein PNM1, mitochondrial [Iris pallida]
MPPFHHLLQLRLLPTGHIRRLSAATAVASPSPDLVQSIAASLSKFSGSDDYDSLHRHFSLHYSDVPFTTPLLADVLLSSPDSGLSAVLLLRHLVRHRGFSPSDQPLSLLIHHLSRRHDFKSIDSLLSSDSDLRPSPGPLSYSALVSRLVRSGRPVDAINLFHSLSAPDTLFSVPKDKSSLKVLVSALADHKFPNHAEKLVKNCAREIFPDEEICNELIRGWCSDLKLDHARRLAGEIVRGGFELGTPAYNYMLDCVCRLCRKRDPVRMKTEAERFLAEMEGDGVLRDSETFRVLIYNLCKIRKTEDAMGLFRRMGEWNCSPCGETYLVLVRSLYQAARVTEGDEMVGWMRSAGFGDMLDRKAYYGFIKILCGIERVEHAMKVFRMMKGFGHAPGIKSYDLLIGKLAEHNQVDRAKTLFKEARARGVQVAEREYKVDPRFVKKKEKKEKKRETLPEKMKKKRRRLKRLRLSFVRKPKKQRRFA